MMSQGIARTAVQKTALFIGTILFGTDKTSPTTSVCLLPAILYVLVSRAERCSLLCKDTDLALEIAPKSNKLITEESYTLTLRVSATQTSLSLLFCTTLVIFLLKFGFFQ